MVMVAVVLGGKEKGRRRWEEGGKEEDLPEG